MAVSSPVPREEEAIEAILVPPKPGFWGAVAWLLGLLVIEVGVAVAVGVALGIVLAVQGIEPDRLWLATVGLALGSVLAALVGWLNIEPPARRTLGLSRTTAFHLFLVLLLILPTLVITDEVATRAGQALDALFGVQAQAWNTDDRGSVPCGALTAYVSWFDEMFDEMLVEQPWIVMLVVLCLLPGIGEEIFFRGFLGRGLVARYGAVRGTLATSLLFGLMHIEPVQACYTFFVGIVLHVVYLSTKSLWCPMLLHAAFNATSLSIRKLVLEGVIEPTGPEGTMPIPWPLLLLAVTGVVALGFVLHQTRTRWFLPDGLLGARLSGNARCGPCRVRQAWPGDPLAAEGRRSGPPGTEGGVPRTVGFLPDGWTSRVRWTIRGKRAEFSRGLSD